MARLRYDILPQGEGWSIAMGGAVGPPDADQAEAVAVASHIAELLTAGGDEIVVLLWRPEGPCPVWPPLYEA